MPGHRGLVGTVSGKVPWPCPVCCTYAWGPVCKAGLAQEQAWGGAGVQVGLRVLGKPCGHVVCGLDTRLMV